MLRPSLTSAGLPLKEYGIMDFSDWLSMKCMKALSGSTDSTVNSSGNIIAPGLLFLAPQHTQIITAQQKDKDNLYPVNTGEVYWSQKQPIPDS